jgi:transcriptional regulator with XRE-family HTH domain
VSREVAALHIGRSYETIAQYETDRIVPPVHILADLADLYGCEPTEFLVEVDTRKATAR